MLGCLVLIAGTGFFTVLGLYMSSLMAYFVALAGALGLYFGGMFAYFTAFIMFLLS